MTLTFAGNGLFGVFNDNDQVSVITPLGTGPIHQSQRPTFSLVIRNQ